MGLITQQTTAVTGNTITAAIWNAEFDNIIDAINGGLDNANIASAAGIAYSKLALTGAIQTGDLNFTPATVAGAETLTNKTLTSPTLNSPTINDGVVNNSRVPITSATANGTYAFDLDTSNHYLITLGASSTLSISGGGGGQAFIVHLKQGSGGSKLVTWFTGILWAGGSSPTLTTTEGKIDSFGFIKNGSDYYGYIIGKNI